MANSGEVIFTVSPDGQSIEVKAQGFKGSGCLDFAKKTLDALGTIEKMEKTPEYFESVGAGVRIGT